MKITFLDFKTCGDLPEIEDLKKFGELVLFNTTKPGETLKRIKDSDVVITNKVLIDRKIMGRTKSLKLICVAATGTNNIDLECARAMGVVVKNVKGYSTDSVAQHTFSMIFNLINHLSYYDEYVKSKRYSKANIFTNLDREIREIKGKRVGIIGLGAIGQRVAQLSEAFGAEVVYYSTSGFNSNSGFKRVDLDELLKTSDIISIHAPLNDKTANLISHKEFKQMKPTVILINAGRGGIVNERDLAKSINQNLIAAAGVDVFEKEPIKKDHPLLKVKDKERILLTPHIAWSSIEARRELINGVCRNIEDFVHS
jgi:lactate dehydrogenase-like 2-hydroxyacid dehydrogenase